MKVIKRLCPSESPKNRSARSRATNDKLPYTEKAQIISTVRNEQLQTYLSRPDSRLIIKLFVVIEVLSSDKNEQGYG